MITDLVPEVGELSDREKHLVAADRRTLAEAARMAAAAQRFERLRTACGVTNEDDKLIELIHEAWLEGSCVEEKLHRLFDELVARDYAGRYRKAPGLEEMIAKYPDFVGWLEDQTQREYTRPTLLLPDHADTCNCPFCRC